VINRGSPDHNSPWDSPLPQPQLVMLGPAGLSGTVLRVRAAQHDLLVMTAFAGWLCGEQHPLVDATATERRANWQQQRPARRRAGEHWHVAPGIKAQAGAAIADGETVASHSSNGKPSVVSANNSVSTPFPHREETRTCVALRERLPILPTFPRVVTISTDF